MFTKVISKPLPTLRPRFFKTLPAALCAVLAATWLAPASLAADQGVPVPAGTWTFVLSKGIPVEANGWEQLAYAPILKRAVMFSQYHQRNSEPNESMVAYNFETNSWEVLDMGGNFHTEHLPEGGESQGYFDFNPINNTIVYHCCTTGSNQPENANHTWWYDLLGQAGRDKHTSPKPPLLALQPGGAFDAAHGVFVFHGGDSLVGTWTYNPLTNVWAQMHPSGVNPDPSLILPALAYNSRTQKIYLFGGLSPSGYSNDLYVYDYPTNTWNLLNPSGTKPSKRNRHAMAYDSANDVFLMYGGQNGTGNLNDSWIYDPTANSWTQVASPQAPPVPITAIFAKLAYDSDHNVFVLAQTGQNGYYGGSWTPYGVQTWLFRYRGTGPNAGTLSSTAAPSPGGLNRNGTSWAKDPALITDGNNLYVSWSEISSPFDSSDAAWPHIFVSQYTAGSWFPLGASYTAVSSTAIKEAHAPSLGMVGQSPWASWYESDNAGDTAQVYSKGWNGATWQGGAVGLVGTTTRLFQGQSQVIGVGGVPHVALLEVDKDVSPQRTLAYVKSWNGSSWTLKGAALNQNAGAGGTALSVSLTTDGTTPYAAWSEYLHQGNSGNGYDNDANPKIYVAQWNGTQWKLVGGALNMDLANWAYDPSITVLNGQLYAAWTERTLSGDSKLYAKVWDGSSWVALSAGALNRNTATGWAFHPSLAGDAATNTLYLGWVEQTALGQKAQAFVSGYSGGVWTSLGTSLNIDPSLGSAQRVSIGVYQGQPVAAWGEVNLGAQRQIYAKRWNGSSWTQLSGSGGQSDTTAPTVPANISAIAASSSRIDVAWNGSLDTVGVAGYLVYRNGAQVGNVTSTLTFSDTGLSANTTYTYKIAAYDGAGNVSAQSAAASAATYALGTGTGGSLSGFVTAPAAAVDLTAEGTLDWAHWGLVSAGSFNHKAAVTPQISTFSNIGGSVSQYSNNPTGFSWSDGTPAGSAVTTTTGVFVSGVSRGFRITAAADTTARTLRVYIGAWHVQGHMVAQLSDGSAPDFVDTFAASSRGPVTLGLYVLTYRAGSSGQSVIVTFTQDSLAPGNVTLQAATLSSGSVAPDFTVAAVPSSQSVAAGSGTNYTLNLTALNGFTGVTGFAVSGQPGGVTPGFSPSTVTGSGSTTLTLTTTAAVPVGSYPLTVTATSGALIHTANITLVVLAPADFTVGASPASQTVVAGGSTTYAVTVTAQNGFAGVTGFAVSGQPGGVTPGFSLSTVTGSGSSTLTLTTTVAAAPGSYPLTVTATSGALSHTANLTLVVTAPASGGLVSGSMATPAGPVMLTTEGSADWGHWGLTAIGDFNHKAAVTPLLSTYTSVGTGTPSRYANNGIGFTWTDGTPAASATNSTTGVFVTGLNNGFRITAPADTNVRTLKIYVGAWRTQGQMVAHLSDGSAADYGDSSLSNLAGVTTLGVYTLNYRSVGAGQTLTVTFTNKTSAGNVTLQAATLAGGVVTPDFTIGAVSSSQTILAGGVASYTVNVTAQNGFSGTTGFALSGLPSGVTPDFSPATVTGTGSTTLTLTTTGAVAVGSYPLTVTATSGTLVHTANITLVVSAAPDFTVGATPASRTIVAGASTSYTVTVTAQNGFSGVTSFAVNGLPSGATAGFSTAVVTGTGNSTLTLTTTAAAAVGSYPLTVTATSGALIHTANITLVVSPPADFTVGASPASQTVVVGGSTTYTVTVTAQNGFAGVTSLTVSGLPSGATPDFSPVTVTGSGSSTLTLTTTVAAAAGTYPLTVTATSGALSHTANLTLIVTAGVGSGLLAGSIATPSGTVSLTTEGGLDWAHWGLNAATDFDHKTGVTSTIPTFTVIGTGTPSRYANNSVGYTWTDGTPNATATNSLTGVFIAGLNNGFQLILPADTTQRTIRIYVGAWRVRGIFSAHMSDASAVDYNDSSLVNTSGVTSMGVYTLVYRAASAGQTVTIKFTQNTLANGNITLQAATLAP